MLLPRGMIGSRSALSSVLVSALVAACGGGGGGGGSPPPPVQQLQLSTTQINFASPSTGGIPPPVQLSGSVSGNPTAVYAKVTYTTNGLGSVATPVVSGSSATSQVSAKAGASLQPGSYTDTITVQACPDSACMTQFAGSPITVNVTYVVGLSIAPNSISVNVVEGSAAPVQSLALVYYGGNGSYTSTVTYLSGIGYQTGSGWLAVPSSGASLPATATANLASTLSPGTYGATLSFTASGGTAMLETSTVSVRYVVTSLLRVAAIKDFSVSNQAGAAGQDQSVAVTSGDSTRNTAWTATVDAGSPWLSPTSATGTTGGTSTLTLALVPSEVAKLHNGHYVAQVSVIPTLKGASTVTVPVGLTLDRSQVATVAPYVEPSGRAGTVILRGAHFDALTNPTVQFGTTAGTVVAVDGPTRMRVTHPALTANQYPVTVTAGGVTPDSSAILVVQDSISYSAAGVGTVPFQFAQFAEFDPERHSCYAASTTKLASFVAGPTSWTVTMSPAAFTAIFGMALSTDGRELLVGDGTQIVHLDPQTLQETHRSQLTAPVVLGAPTFADLSRVDDGTIVFLDNGIVWSYQPWARIDSQLFAGTALVQTLQTNRTGNQLILNYTPGSTNLSILDSMSLAQSLAFASAQFGNIYSAASDRFGARWAFTPVASGLMTAITDGKGSTLGQVSQGYATSNALSDDGRTLVVPGLASGSNAPIYSRYDLSPVATGGAPTLKGTVSGTIDVNDRNFYLKPQQNEVINCGIVSISAAVLP
jgi:IPT/TIG domain-containing protein